MSQFFSFSDLTWEILSAISSKGAQGLVSLDLSKWFNKTPKDLHYHTKKLLQQGLMYVLDKKGLTPSRSGL